MISKELFVRTIGNIKKQGERNERVGKSLEEVCDGWVLFGTKDLYLESLLEVLEAIFDDQQYQMIQWWVWEDVEKVVWLNDGTEIRLDTAEQLYDFLVESMKKE